MDVQLLDCQFKFLTSEEKICFFIAGIGTGKSFTLAHIALNHIIKYPNSNILLVANTHAQLINATIPALTGLLDELSIAYNSALGGAKKYIQVNNTTIFIYSLENYNVIRGIEVGLVCGDEICYSKREAFDVVMGRLRCKNGSLRARFCSSPAGFNWVYDLINERKAAAVYGKTTDNVFLPSEYIENLIQLYGGLDSPLAKQEVLGQFVNLTSGAVYYAFDRTKHLSKLSINPLLPIYVGLDFNVENMCFTYCQYEQGVLKVVKEVNLATSNANTFDAAAKIKSDLANHNVKIVPDSTGKSRKTSAEAGRSDITILKDFGLNVLDTQNPRIKDRHNTVNSLFMRGKLLIDDSCSKLIKELETLKHDDDEGSKSHLAVGMGYVAWKLEPLKPPQQQSQTLQNPVFGRR